MNNTQSFYVPNGTRNLNPYLTSQQVRPQVRTQIIPDLNRRSVNFNNQGNKVFSRTNGGWMVHGNTQQLNTIPLVVNQVPPVNFQTPTVSYVNNNGFPNRISSDIKQEELIPIINELIDIIKLQKDIIKNLVDKYGKK